MYQDSIHSNKMHVYREVAEWLTEWPGAIQSMIRLLIMTPKG